MGDAPSAHQLKVRVVLDKDAWDEKQPGVDGLPASDTAQHRRLQHVREQFQIGGVAPVEAAELHVDSQHRRHCALKGPEVEFWQ